jgi:hypothetical protein
VRAAVVVAVGTGIRRGGQLKSRRGRVDVQRDATRVPNAKAGQTLRGADQLAGLVELKRGADGSEYVFANPRTGQPCKELRMLFDTA